MRDTTRVGRGDDGAAAVEFALISLPLMLLLFGTIQYGLYFFQATAAEHGLREGARLASVGQLDCVELAKEIEVRAGPPRGADPNPPRPAYVDRSTVTVSYTDGDDGGGFSRGDTLTVTGSWTPIAIGFFPLPGGGGPVAETAVTSVEYIGAHGGTCP